MKRLKLIYALLRLGAVASGRCCVWALLRLGGLLMFVSAGTVIAHHSWPMAIIVAIAGIICIFLGQPGISSSRNRITLDLSSRDRDRSDM